MIPYGKQNISEEDISAVVDVLRSDFLTQGPKTSQFEEAISVYCGSKYALAVNSATSALHIACLALNLKKGDWLWTSPNTFVATTNCGLFCGANVDFVDIDPKTYNMCCSALEEKLLEARKRKCLPKIVIPVHFGGLSCDMRKIKELSKKFKFSVIEDASHAIGGRYHGKPIGNCEFSDITVFSLHPVKIITSGEGGLALTNDKNLNKRMKLFLNHGITRDPELMTKDKEGPWFYEQITLGYNYRMTEIQAALGLSQMDRLDEFVVKRNELSQRYENTLADLPFQLQEVSSSVYSARHLYVIRTFQKQRRKLFDKLRNEGIGVNFHYIPVHLQTYYRNLGFQEGDCPKAESYAQEAISIPLYPSMTIKQQDHIINILKGSCAKSHL